jgi:hypothetical protein
MHADAGPGLDVTVPDSAPEDPAPTAEARPVPDGYRQGLITAITVLLGFSLTFLRYWGFDAPGQWALRSVISTGASIAAVLLQLVALVRALRIEDQYEHEYRQTVRWFIASAVALLLGLLLGAIELATTGPA